MDDPCGRPDAQAHVGDRLAQGPLQEGPEVVVHLVGVGDDVDLAQQRGRDEAQFGHVRVGPDAPGVALEHVGAPSQSSLEILVRLALVAPVGEQVGQLDGSGWPTNTSRARSSQVPMAVPPSGCSWRATFAASARVMASARTSEGGSPVADAGG